MPPVIQVENLSKLYRLGEVSTGTLSHDLNRWWHKVRGKEDPYLKIGQVNDRTKRKAGRENADNGKADKLKEKSDISAFQNLSVSAFESDYVFALKDINFSVNQGEVLGIIGRNGAGKSTLLKILSRVTAPTAGKIKVKGRIAALLEVGTGFHPELTGRENTYLNGAILGMRSHEIKHKLDEIVEFSGCAAFFDTPVKRYSSGMQLRLAFAVAAHLEPEILIVDEVLAVGDAEFQKKCLGKMQEVANGGRTVLFVSHNIGAVSKLCTTGLMLVDGTMSEHGHSGMVISSYLKECVKSTENYSKDANIQAKEHPFILRKINILNMEGNETEIVRNSENFIIRITYELTSPMRMLRVGFRLHMADDSTVVLSSTNCDDQKDVADYCSAGVHVSEVKFPGNLLNKGQYYLWIGVDIPMVSAVLSLDQAARFSIEAVSGRIAEISDSRLGVIAPILPWKTTKLLY